MTEDAEGDGTDAPAPDGAADPDRDATSDAPTHGDDAGEAVPNERAALDPEATVEAPSPTRDLPSPSAAVPDPTAVAGDEDDETVAVPDPTADEDAETVAVPRRLWLSFWYLVVVFNAAVLASGVGLLLVTLGDDPELGGRLLFAGGVLGLYGYYRYRRNPYRDGAHADADPGA